MSEWEPGDDEITFEYDNRSSRFTTAWDRLMADDAPPWPPEAAPMAPAGVWPVIEGLYSASMLNDGAYVDLLAEVHRAGRYWTCWICASTWLGSIDHDCPRAKNPDRAFQRRLMARATKAFRVRPHQIGIYPPCACHPAPNPAARDYRRRTKHRRRRRR